MVTANSRIGQRTDDHANVASARSASGVGGGQPVSKGCAANPGAAKITPRAQQKPSNSNGTILVLSASGPPNGLPESIGNVRRLAMCDFHAACVNFTLCAGIKLGRARFPAVLGGGISVAQRGI